MKTRFLSEARALWQLAWPVLVGQLATVGMGVSDVAMTGHLSATDLAAVAIGTSLWAIVIVSVMGVMMAINALVAHEIGAAQEQRVPALMRQALWMGLGVGLTGCLLLNLGALSFDFLDLSPAVLEKSRAFVHIISFGLPAFALYRALYGYTTSLNQTKPVMLIALFGLGFNICVNYLLIYGHFGLPRLGASGCAVSTGVGMWLMLALMVLWTRRAAAYQTSAPWRQFDRPRWAQLRPMLRLGLPIGITYLAEASAFCAVGLLVARFGEVNVAANQIALNFSSLVFMVPMSLGIALTTRVGHALGEGDPLRARHISWIGIGLSLGFAVLSALGILLLREPIAAAYTSDPAVQAQSAALLLYAALFQLSDAAQVTTACAIRGYKITRSPMLIHLLAFYGLALPLGIALGLAPGWLPWRPSTPLAAEGFWIGLVAALTLAALLLLRLLQRVSRVGPAALLK